MNEVKTWSYSTGAMFKTCKHKFKCYVIDKIKEEDNFFQARGQSDHKIAEYYVNGKVTGTPEQLKNFKKEMDVLKNSGKALVEKDLAITQDFKPTTWDDWDNVWLRGKGDVIFPMNKSETEIVVIDHKFGKRWGTYQEQMLKYFIAAMSHFPTAKKVVTELWFHKLSRHDNDRIEQKIYTCKDLKPSQDIILKEWSDIKAEEEFKPNSSATNCKWCYYAKDKSGNCPYNSNGEL